MRGMFCVEGGEHCQIKEVIPSHPGSFIWVAPLPVNKVLKMIETSALQDLTDCIYTGPSSRSKRGGSLATHDSGEELDKEGW